MTSKTTYYCDRCGCEIPHENHPAYSFGTLYDTYDLCEYCADKFKLFMKECNKA